MLTSTVLMKIPDIHGLQTRKRQKSILSLDGQIKIMLTINMKLRLHSMMRF